VAQVDDSLACRDRCEEKVSAINRLIGGAPAARTVNALAYRRSGLSAVIAGILFAVFGASICFYSQRNGGSLVGALFIGLGAITIVNGLLAIRTGKTMRELK
jgi:hypothetical protein